MSRTSIMEVPGNMPASPRVPGRICIFVLAVLAAALAFAQQSSRSLTGDWMATAGQQVLRGAWTAQTSSRTSNSAYGSWTLIAGDGELVAQGTWSARKSAGEWHGTWTARVGNGRSLSGSWDAAVSDSKIKTFAEMFQATSKKQISGEWHSGGNAGNWWLEASPPRSGKP
jgi:hypothetical protein